MRLFNKALFLLVLASLVIGCTPAGVMGASVLVDDAAPTATPNYVSVPADATPTPTPFRPIPPTAVYYPTETPLPTATPTASPTPTSIVDEYFTADQLQQPKGQINILLLGADQRPWNTGGRRFRTDTIILATLNYELGTLNLTSFPRDLYVNIPGHGQDRINTAYQFGGWEMLRDTFKANFGVVPDHYVIINFLNFKRFVDSLGGLEVNVGQQLADYRDGYWVTVDPGVVYMDADMVLWYVRSRKTSNDFVRNRRQQEVLQAIMQEVISLENIRKVPELYEIYKDSVTTDLGLGDILPMLPLAVKLMEPDRINHYFVGPKHVNSWVTPGGAMVLLPIPDAVRNIIRKSQNMQQ
jgi:LCP family protein required for cell wall assembly